MFACAFDCFYAVGQTVQEAWEQVQAEAAEAGFDDLEPDNCWFFEEVQVTAQEVTHWSLDLASDFDSDRDFY